MHTHNQSGSRQNSPIVRRDLRVIGKRVVRIQTKQLAEATWVAIGHVSTEIPTGMHLAQPVEIRATGHTESEAINALKQRISRLDHAMD